MGHCVSLPRQYSATHQEPYVLPECLTALTKMVRYGGGTLESLIQSSRFFQCSEPRDRIYGMLGLVQYFNHDYAKIPKPLPPTG